MTNDAAGPASAITVESWDETHPRWHALESLIKTLSQWDWFTFHAPFHQTSRVLAATCDGTPVGFLRFVIQAIGPDQDCPPVVLNGKELKEAKVIAFAVLPEHRRKGVGRALQQRTLQQARALGCHQLRSHSSGTNRANHHLKLSLGFAVHPTVRGDDREGAYFVMPLATNP